MTFKLCTRPSINFSIWLVSLFQKQYTIAHWKLAKRIFRYLYGTVEHYVIYLAGDLCLTDYCEVAWASDKDELHFCQGISIRRSSNFVVQQEANLHCFTHNGFRIHSLLISCRRKSLGEKILLASTLCIV